PAFLAAATRTRVTEQVADGQRLLAAGRIPDADDRLGAALRLDASSAPALRMLGAVRRAGGRLDEAKKAAESALASDPKFARAEWALAEIARARGAASAARPPREKC